MISDATWPSGYGASFRLTCYISYTGSKERGFESHSCQKSFVSLLDFFFLLLGVLLLIVGAVMFLVLGELPGRGREHLR
jgi:hypothetical protein